jgi:hypothetical protein
MKHGLVIEVVAGLVLFSLTVPSPAQEAPKKYNLTLSGGYGTITGGDVPTVMDGMNAKIHDLAEIAGFSVVDTLEVAKWGPELEAEFLFRPARSFGLGFGIGYLRKADDTRVAGKLDGLAGISLDWTATYQVIPLKLSGYYFFKAGSKLAAYAKAGIGYYFGRMTYSVRIEETLPGIALWEQNDGEASAGGLGFHGGLGLEYPLSPSFSLFLEAAGRYLNLKDWSVENDYSTAWGSESETGKFWFAEELDSELGQYYPTLYMVEERPSDPDLRNVREAAFGFSGFALKAGVKIRF